MDLVITKLLERALTKNSLELLAFSVSSFVSQSLDVLKLSRDALGLKPLEISEFPCLWVYFRLDELPMTLQHRPENCI